MLQREKYQQLLNQIGLIEAQLRELTTHTPASVASAHEAQRLETALSELRKDAQIFTSGMFNEN